jgi:hypothetical protein
LYEELERLSLEIVEEGQLNELRVKYTLEDQIRQAQKGCPEIQEVKRQVERGKAADCRLDDQGTLWLKDRICVPRTGRFGTRFLERLTTLDTRSTLVAPRCTRI